MSIAYKENGVWKTVSGIPPIDDALSDTSENPVQNKVVKQGLDGKSNTSHNHDDRYYTEAEVNQIIEALNNADIQKIERNGTTFTVTRNDGTTFTFTQQDNNTTYSNGTGLNLSGTTFSVKYGTTAGTACQGNDSRLSDSRTPTSHASTGTGYGAGNASNYGHVKVSDNYTSSAGNASQSVAASSAAVVNAYLHAKIEYKDLTKTVNLVQGLNSFSISAVWSGYWPYGIGFIDNNSTEWIYISKYSVTLDTVYITVYANSKYNNIKFTARCLYFKA